MFLVKVVKVDFMVCFEIFGKFSVVLLDIVKCDKGSVGF